jgi:hypothetical protein
MIHANRSHSPIHQFFLDVSVTLLTCILADCTRGDCGRRGAGVGYASTIVVGARDDGAVTTFAAGTTNVN